MKGFLLVIIAFGVWSIAFDINAISHGLMPAKCSIAQPGEKP